MRFKRTLAMVVVAGGLLAFVAAPASAETYIDAFWFQQSSGMLDGGGSGYDWGSGAMGGVWELYDPGGQHAWYNQWFFDGNLRLDWHKDVWLDITVVDAAGLPWDPAEPLPFDMVINWSTDGWDTSEWDPADRRPPNPLEEDVIGRSETLDFGFDGIDTWSTFYQILDYNPEWVSIDIWPWDPMVDFLVQGDIEHNCIPEPATLVIWSALGLLGIMAGWRRRRRVAKTR